MTAKVQETTQHGVFMDVLGLGILITGKSGIGKSELALGLINRSHRLIADDAPSFFIDENQHLVGHCPTVLQDFLEVRGLGVLNIRAMFGDNALRDHKRLQLIIHMAPSSDERLHHADRLHGTRRLRTIAGISVPKVTIPVAPGRNLAILVEAAVRDEILRLTGYEASVDFSKKQQDHMEK